MWTQKDEKRLEENCFYGFYDRGIILDAVIYYGNRNVSRKIPLLERYNIPLKEKYNFLLQEATQMYKQFYRFVYMNDTIANTQYNKKFFCYENEEEEKHIRNIVKKRLGEMIKQNKIFLSKAGIYFYREQEKYFCRECAYEKNYSGEQVWWTEEVCKLLTSLKNLEKEDKIEYYDKWLYTKLQRAKNVDENPKEIKILEDIYNMFQQRKTNAFKKCKNDDAR